jgi:hypothetical protein
MPVSTRAAEPKKEKNKSGDKFSKFSAVPQEANDDH